MSTTSDRILRDRQRYTGDGLPNEPTNAALPIGDPQSGAHTATLPEWRELYDTVELAGVAATEDRIAAELARDIAVAAASDAVSQSNVPVYSTAAAIATLVIPVGLTAFRTNGYATVGDGGHALYAYEGTAGPLSLGGVADDSVTTRYFRLVPLDNTVSVVCFGTVGNDVADDRPAIQNAIDFMEDAGGGTVLLRRGTYRLSSTTTRNCVTFTTNVLGIVATAACLWVPAMVSIRGEKGAKLKRTSGSLSAVLATFDWSDASLSGFEIEGPGTATTCHGILTMASDVDEPQLIKNIAMRDLYLHDIGAYGIGLQYGHLENATFENLRITRTGADGIDYKGRFGTVTAGNPEESARGVRFDNILIESPAQRLDTNSDGISIAGPCTLSNIHVRGLGRATGHMSGIVLRPGFTVADEHRGSATRSSLTNFLVEGVDPSYNTTGVTAYSSGPVTISNGLVRWCRRGVWSREETATPRFFLHGPLVSGVTVEGCRHDPADTDENAPFVLEREHTSLMGCRSISDTQYFDANRGNLTAAQTDFLPVGGLDMTATGGWAVLKNGTLLTLTTHYTAITDGFRLVTAALVTDEIIFIAKSVRACRVVAENCSIVGLDVDKWHVNNLSLEENVLATTLTAGMRDPDTFISLRGQGGVARVDARSIVAANVDLLLAPLGTGFVRIGLANVPNYASSAAAAAAGVPVNGIFRTGEALKIRT